MTPVGWDWAADAAGLVCCQNRPPAAAAMTSTAPAMRAGNSFALRAGAGGCLAPFVRSNGNTLSSRVPVRTNCASPLANSSSFASVSSKALIQLRDASS